MVFKIAKFFTKIAIGTGLVVAAFVFILYLFVGGVKTYFREGELPYNDASYIVRAHQTCEESEIGTGHVCCIPGCETIFYKKSNNVNACCPEHERQYQEIYKSWLAGLENKEKLEKQGVKFI
jgi:hypothetical protein